MSQRTSIREAYMQASSFLYEKNISDAAYCTELLLRHLLGWSRAQFYADWNTPMPQELAERWQQFVTRRATGEPAQYIIGEQDFYGLTFRVNRHVLIPRPETELLVEQVLLHAERYWSEDEENQAVRHVTDVGTGSGSIAVTLAVKRPHWQVTAIDISNDALAVAHGNACRHGVSQSINFQHGDGLFLLGDGEQAVAPRIDILVSNPPYITSEEMKQLQREVHDYEPHLALCGGVDGLDVYRHLIAQMQRLPQLPSIVAFETGFGQTEVVAALLLPFYEQDKIKIVHDLAGKDRIVIAVY